MLLWHEALSIFERAIALRPHNKKVISLSFIQIGSVSPSLNERISAYQKASNADPESEEAHWCLAVELWRANRFQQSWDEWKYVEYYVNKRGEATDRIQKYLQMTEKEIASPNIESKIPSVLKDWFEGAAQLW
jgi:cytochrome c-type biogenesis protein CcmH/NrfG